MAYRYTDVNTRTVYSAVSGRVGGTGKIAKFWLDAAATQPVDLGLYSSAAPDTPGASTGSNQLAVGADGMWPAMWDRDGGQDHVYVQVGTAASPGDLYVVYCDADQRLDTLTGRVAAVETGGAGDQLLLHKAGAETVTGVKTFTAQPVVPTPTAATSPTTRAYVQAGLSGRVSGLSALAKILAAGTRSCAIQVLSDSTANGVGPTDADWPHLLGQNVAAAYPAWTVHHRVWNDATQDYDAPIVIQTGTAGARYLDCDSGTAGLRLDPAASPHLSGVIDVRAKVREATWTPSAGSGFSGLVVKGAGSPSIEWRFGLANSGLLNFFYSTAGTATVGIGSTATVGSAGATPGSIKWLRCLFNPDDGAGNRVTKFYTGDDGVAWTQLGTTVTTAGAVTVFTETTTGYQLGGIDSAVAPGADIFEVQIRNGDGGPQVVPSLPDGWGVYGGATTNATVSGAPVLTIVNGCNAGSGITYLGDATRLPKLTPDYGQAAIFLSTSHNETRKMGAQWITAYTGWIASVRARLPHGALIPLTQNPELAGAQYSGMHAQRRMDLIAWSRSAGVDLIDTYGAFLADGRDLATVLLADTIHPSLVGSGLWADTIMAELSLAV